MGFGIFFFSHQREQLTVKTNHQQNGASCSGAAAAGPGSVRISEGRILGFIAPDLGVLCYGGWDSHPLQGRGGLRIFPSPAQLLHPRSPLLAGEVCRFPAPHSHRSPQMHLIHTADNDRKLQCNKIMGFIYRICFPITPT